MSERNAIPIVEGRECRSCFINGFLIQLVPANKGSAIQLTLLRMDFDWSALEANDDEPATVPTQPIGTERYVKEFEAVLEPPAAERLARALFAAANVSSGSGPDSGEGEAEGGPTVH